jgi:hypothetical protein
MRLAEKLDWKGLKSDGILKKGNFCWGNIFIEGKVTVWRPFTNSLQQELLNHRSQTCGV